MKRRLALLAVAATAAVILYNGHAGLGSNIQDGTSNTMMSAVVLMPDMGGQFRRG